MSHLQATSCAGAAAVPLQATMQPRAIEFGCQSRGWSRAQGRQWRRLAHGGNEGRYASCTLAFMLCAPAAVIFDCSQVHTRKLMNSAINNA